MTATRQRLLDGRRGWATVVVLVLALAMLLVGQLAAVEARAGGLEAPAALPVTGPAVPAEPAVEVVAAPVPAAAEPASAPAPVVEPVDDLCSGPGWQQRRGEAALASLSVRPEQSGFAVDFGPARSGYMGLTHLQERRIEVFVRGCDVQSDGLLRHVVAHELGHAYDTALMTDEARAAWQQARGIPATTDWYGCSGCSDFATPAGDFAEVYAQWARSASDNRSELGGAPGPAALAELAARFFGA